MVFWSAFDNLVKENHCKYGFLKPLFREKYISQILNHVLYFMPNKHFNSNQILIVCRLFVFILIIL